MTTQSVGDRRLLQLAEFLEGLPRARFNYGSFIGEDWQGAQNLSCGTTACALGWAAAMPEFRRLGLRLVRLTDDPEEKGGTVQDKVTGQEDEYAAMRVFGLTEQEAYFLFIPRLSYEPRGPVPNRKPGNRATARQVAAHIRRFVKKRPVLEF